MIVDGADYISKLICSAEASTSVMNVLASSRWGNIYA